jgi:hypothetical protein
MADLSVTAANVKPGTGAKLKQATSAVAITAGQVVYKLADGTIGVADANGTAPANQPVGIAVCSTPGAGQAIVYTDNAPLFEPGATTSVGAPYFLSANPGGIAPAADLASGMLSTLIGFGLASNKMKVELVQSGVAIP